MSFTNYWDPNSGDSQSSPWGQFSSKYDQLNGTTNPTQPVMDGIDNTMSYAGGTPDFYNQPMDQTGLVGNELWNQQNATPTQTQRMPGQEGNPWTEFMKAQESSPTSFMQNMAPRQNMDRMQEDIRYGAETTNQGIGGGGYWSGGRPGSGSWVEGERAAVAAPPPPPPAEMVPGAPAQTPARTAPVADVPTSYTGPQDYANFDWQAYATANPDVLASNYGGGNTFSSAADQMWHHWSSANQGGDLRAYTGYFGGRVNPYTGQAINSGAYAGPASNPYRAPAAAPSTSFMQQPAMGGGYRKLIGNQTEY